LLRMHCVWRNSMGEQMQSQNRHLMTLDGDVPREIDFLWHDCATSVRAEAWLDGCDIVARIPSRMPDEVRYAWSNSPESGLICDGDGVLLPPFHLPLPMVD
jgi:sialate O-acetylesterase